MFNSTLAPTSPTFINPSLPLIPFPLPVLRFNFRFKRIKRTNQRGPFRTAKSIVSGIRKWEERYLAECHGHRSGRHMNKRHNFMRMVLRKFTPAFCNHDDCLEEGFAQKFKWGGKNLKTTV